MLRLPLLSLCLHGLAFGFSWPSSSSKKADAIPGITVVDYQSWRQIEIADMKLSDHVKYAKFFLDPETCQSLPSGLERLETSDIFHITCPEGVDKVTLNFIKPEDDPTALSFFSSGGSVKESLTMKLKGFDTVEDKGLQCRYDDGKKICTALTFKAHNKDDSVPLLQSVTVDRTPVYPKAYHPSSDGSNYSVTLFARQPVWISARVNKPFKVDSMSPGEEKGEVDSVTHFQYTPTKASGNYFNLYLTNMDRSVSKVVRVDVDLLEGGMDLLSNVEVFPGYLEPQFRPHMYTYFLRVPWFTPAVSLVMKGVDGRKTLCSVDGGKAQSAGISHTVSLPDFHAVADHDVLVDCWAEDDPDLRTRYVYQIIRNKDGQTSALELNPIGCELQHKFDPMFKGPYTCDLRLSDNETVPWVNFYVRPSSDKASCSVNDHPIDRSTNLSTHFRIPLGDTQRFKVRCKTPNVEVDETYVIDVKRPMIGLSVAKAGKLGNAFGWMSTLFSSHRAHIFLHNNFMHRFVSSTARTSTGESYNGFASAFHKFNLFPKRGSLVKFTHDEWADDSTSQLENLNLSEGSGGHDGYHSGSKFEGDRLEVLTTLEADYQRGQNLVDYSSNIVLSIILLLVASVGYAVTWALYLRKSKKDMTTLRRDFPKWLHPSRFWTFLFDFATISWVTSGVGLLTAKKSYEISVLGIKTSTKTLGAVSIILLLIGPLLFFGIACFILFKIKSDVVYSKSLLNYHDQQVVYARALARYAYSIPILDAFMTVEVSNAMPICRLLDDSLAKDPEAIKKCFREDDRQRDPIIFHSDTRPRPSMGSHNPKDAYAAACGGEEASMDSCLIGNAKYHRFTGLGSDSHSAAKRYRGFGDVAGGGVWNDLVRVDMDDATFCSSTQVLHHLEVMEKHPHGVVGFKRFFTRNPYDHYVEALCEVQLQHLTQIGQTLSPCRMTTYVPMDHLSFPSNMKYNNLIGPYGPGQYRSMPFKWIIDRLFLATMCVAVVSTNPGASVYVTSVWSMCALIFSVCSIPSAIKTAHAQWYRSMETAAYEARRATKVDEEMENLYRVWPFRSSEVRGRYKVMRLRKLDHSCLGMYGSYRIFIKEPLQKFKRSFAFTSYFSRIVWCCFTGPVFQELMKAAALMFIALSNPLVNILSNSAGATGAILCLACCMISIGWPTIIDWYRVIRLFLRECYFKLVRFLWYFNDLIRDKNNRSARMKHLSSQISKAISRKKANWAFPGYSREWVREFEIDELYVVSNEIGTHHPGRIFAPYRTERVREAMDSQEKRRFGISKTLVKNGPTGYFRDSIDRSLPVQLPFSDLYHGNSTELSRLAATFQIVNHGGHRYPKRHSHWDDDDSFLSFYTDPRFVPRMGELRDSFKGHGYSVRYSAEQHSLVIRGPGLKPGFDYSIRTSSSSPPTPDGYTEASSQGHSDLSSEHSLTPSTSVEVHCSKHGRLVVQVPHGKAPDLNSEIEVYPPYGAEKFLIRGQQSRIDWDPHHREMNLYSRHAVALNDPYRVVWNVAVKGKRFNVEGVQCTMPNIIIAKLPEDQKNPNLNDFIAVRDHDNHCIDIDPRDTDAHQFNIPDIGLSGVGRGFARLAYRPSEFSRQIVGQERIDDVVSSPIPCTVVQCVNPIEREFRVEPNFAEGIKILTSKKEELYAHKQGLDSPEHLAMTSMVVMSSSEFIDFWKTHGLDITERGRWLNPFIESSHSIFRGKSGLVRTISGKLRQELDGRFARLIGQINQQINTLNLWAKAYADPQLMSLQQKRDEADWNMAEVDDMMDIAEALTKHKAQYEASIPNFQFPMVVYDRLISRKPNLAAQYACWQVQVANWLHEEEAACTQPFNGGESCLKQTTFEFMNNLTKTFERPENLLDHKFNSVLHYVTPSRSIRGMDAIWRPDPLVAQGACVRVWPSDGSAHGANFNAEPIWLTCLIKLTGNAVCIYLPGPHDAARKFSYPFKWKHIYGYTIPLKCFQQLEINKRDSEPSGKPDQNVIGLRTEITWRKQLQIPVDDHYVRRIENNEVCNTIKFPDGHGVDQSYKLMLGNTITGKDIHKYPANEVSSYGDTHTAYPLTFRVNNLYYPRWRDVILGCQMYDNHRNLDGFNGCLATAPEPISVSSSSVSFTSSKSLPTADLSKTKSDSTSLMTTLSESNSAIVIHDKPESSTSSSSLPPEVLERDITPSEHDPSSSSSEPPPPLPVTGMYRGQWKNWRYHGFGTLKDNDGDVVYEGEWRDGLRWGFGLCNFFDQYGCKWKYEGEFVQDEFCGKGTLELVDHKEESRLKDDGKTYDNFRLTRYSGYFKLPGGMRRRGSFTDVDNRTHKAYMKKFFEFNKDHLDYPLMVDKHHQDVSSSSSTSSTSSSSDNSKNILPPSDNDDPKKTLVVDMSRYIMMGGAFDLAALGVHEISKNYENETATLKPKRQKAASDSESISLIGTNEAIKTMELMLPHRTKWMRELDPRYGFANIAERLTRGHVTFANGSQYEGHLQSGLPHGKGYFQGVHGTEYEGNFLHGVPHGFGIMENQCDKRDKQHLKDPNNGDWPTRFQHVGEFYAGTRSGRGVTVSLDDKGAHFMCGNYKNDILSGGAAYLNLSPRLRPDQAQHHANQERYQVREFIGYLDDQGLPQGSGKCYWWDDVMYRGQFFEGQRSSALTGSGDQISDHNTGSLYDNLHRRICVSSWLHDTPHGQVNNLVFRDEITYTGSMQKGAREGMGELYNPDGSLLYEGQFRNGLPHGRGTLYCVNGDPDSQGYYEGMFAEGGPNGHGKFTWSGKKSQVPNGKSKKRFYEGEWLNWLPDGVGKYLDSDGSGEPNVYKWTHGSPAPGELKRYAKSKLVVYPKIDKEHLEPKLKTDDPEYWHRKRHLKSDPWKDIHALGRNMWLSETEQNLRYVKPNDVAKLKDVQMRPNKYIPGRLRDIEADDMKLMERITKAYGSISDGVASTIQLRTHTTESKKRNQYLKIHLFQGINIGSNVRQIGAREKDVLEDKYKNNPDNKKAIKQAEKDRKKAEKAAKKKNKKAGVIDVNTDGMRVKTNDLTRLGAAEDMTAERFDPFFIVRVGRNQPWRTKPMSKLASTDKVPLNVSQRFTYGRERNVFIELWNRRSITDHEFLGEATVDLTKHVKEQRGKKYNEVELVRKAHGDSGESVIAGILQLHIEISGDDVNRLSKGSSDYNQKLIQPGPRPVNVAYGGGNQAAVEKVSSEVVAEAAKSKSKSSSDEDAKQTEGQG
eukprot:GHVH01015327.1.p1 GENE.GHVH01015327.1~~GHVH01015327.1.p1  ORF type:complete len:3214 (+),score=431.26 GHVH01015327.1:218-9859(+)